MVDREADELSVVVAKHDNHSCETDNGLCAHSCTTLYSGGYMCHCRDGFRVSPEDYKSCIGKLITESYPAASHLSIIYLTVNSQCGMNIILQQKNHQTLMSPSTTTQSPANTKKRTFL